MIVKRKILKMDVNEDPGEDVALLSVSFEDTEATQVYPKLYLSPRIEQLLAVSHRETKGEMGIGDSRVLISERYG
ncbi:hypothetical protein STEG23_008350 [Scotinomys teguina]